MSVPSHMKTQISPFTNKDISQVPTVAVPTVTPPSSSSKKRRGKPLSLRTKILLWALLAALLIPTLILLVQVFYMFLIYNQARDGMTHLQNAQQAFSSDAQSNAAKYFNINNLQKAQQEIDAAHSDFVAVRDSLDSNGVIGMSSMMLPQQITTARSLSHIGVDATEIMQQLIKTAIKLAPTIGPVLANPPSQNQTDSDPTINPAASLKPVLMSEGFEEVMADLNGILPLLHDMNKYVSGVSLNSLPLSASQQQLLSGVLSLLPQAEALVQQAVSMKGDVRWLLGIDQARNFLVEPMDSGELRATGGFTGQFGLLTINGGNLQSPKFRNIGLYEEDLTYLGTDLSPIFEKVKHQKPSAPYNAWWPIANFGLRDANISADFPTSAQMMMKAYTHEFEIPVDGVISFTPFLIEHILTVTGPLTIPEYNETITSQNLIDRLHYYQLDNTGIRKAQDIEHEEDSQIARKLFTGRVTSALISAVQHLPMNKLQSMIQMVFSSMKSKDLQMYVTNPQLESLIGKYGSTNALNRSTDKDGLFIVQSNLSASKATTYVNTTINDTITLSPSGSATHKMLVTLDYQKKGDVYGFDTYRDYVRVYVPQGSQYLAGNGFDLYEQPLCGSDAGLQACPSDVYGDGTLICPANTTSGYATWHLYDPYFQKIHPIDRVGPPTNRTSDESGRDMYGGWAVVPKNCTLTFSLSWTSPPATGNHPYSLLIQRQAATFPKVNLTIHPAPGTCSAPLQYSGTMDDQDQLFTIQQDSSRSTCKLQVTNSAQ
jgi:hypothetical protein